jgi:hypothetical protein
MPVGLDLIRNLISKLSKAQKLHRKYNFKVLKIKRLNESRDINKELTLIETHSNHRFIRKEGGLETKLLIFRRE